MYSSPPGHGAAIATAVLSDPALFCEWERELQGMAGAVDGTQVLLVLQSCWHVN
jgi:aspartate/tyrosine/aromatic aminotransferase